MLARECGVCWCSADRTVLLCESLGLVAPPIIPADVQPKVVGIGLQRNLTYLPHRYLDQFPALQVVYIMRQRSSCVYMDSDPSQQKFEIIIIKDHSQPGPHHSGISYPKNLGTVILLHHSSQS